MGISMIPNKCFLYTEEVHLISNFSSTKVDRKLCKIQILACILHTYSYSSMIPSIR